MSTIDIRNMQKDEITEIVFAETKDKDGDAQAYKACLMQCFDGYVTIEDSDESVVISSKEHAQNLIKALEKAIELGWLK